MKTLLFFFLVLTSLASEAMVVPSDAYTFDFNIKTFRMSRAKEEKLYLSIDVLKQIFASAEFKQRILGHKFQGRRQFYKNEGLSNRQIYYKLLRGMERLSPWPNNAMDVEIELYSNYNSNVLGYTKPRTKRIWMNTKYFNKHSPSQVASHLTHEWLHKLGFEHERHRCDRRKYSVPYAIGYIVRDLAKKYK